MWKSGKKGTRGKWLAALESQTGAKVGNDVAFSLRICIFKTFAMRLRECMLTAQYRMMTEEGRGLIDMADVQAERVGVPTERETEEPRRSCYILAISMREVLQNECKVPHTEFFFSGSICRDEK